jgi:hypothetical protein
MRIRLAFLPSLLHKLRHLLCCWECKHSPARRHGQHDPDKVWGPGGVAAYDPVRKAYQERQRALSKPG